MKQEISLVPGFNNKEWLITYTYLNKITMNRFKCFYNNHILKDIDLYKEFSTLLEIQFDYFKDSKIVKEESFSGNKKKEVIRVGEVAYQVKYSSRTAYSKDPTNNNTISPYLLDWIDSFNLRTRLIGSPCSKACNSSCGCK